MRQLLLPILLLVGFCTYAFNPLPVQYLGIEQGLSNNTVISIYKDRPGFMWFGTHDGLNRYDGYTFKVFRRDLKDSSSLLSNEITALAEDRRGNLWVASRRGVNVYNYASGRMGTVQYRPWSPRRPLPLHAMAGDIYDIKADAAGNMFVAGSGTGIIVVPAGGQGAFQLPLQKPGDTTTNYAVYSLKITAEGAVWCIVQGYGLCQYEYTTRSLRLVSNAVTHAYKIESDKSGRLWMATDHGLYAYTIATGQAVLFLLPERLYSYRILGLCLDADEQLWVGSDGGGMGVIDTRHYRVLTTMAAAGGKSLTSDAVSCIYTDHENRKWIGTLRGGINIIDKKRSGFATIAANMQQPGGLKSDFIFSFCEDNNKQIWIGTDGGGITIWDRALNKFTTLQHHPGHNSPLSGNNISSLVAGDEDDIWIGSYGGGIDRYFKRSGKWAHYDCRVWGKDNDNVWKLFIDSHHNVWAGTCVNGYLYLFDKRTNRFELFDYNIRDILSIAEDRNGHIWAGGFKYLVEIDATRKHHRYYDLGTNIRDIHAGKDNLLWIATQGRGLQVLDTARKQFTSYTVENGLCNNVVLSIQEDDKTNIWVSTFNGISRYDRSSHRFDNFYYSDGLQSNQFNYNAGTTLSSGEIVFGGIKGFNLFHPDSVRTYNDFPPLVVTGVKILNEPAGADGQYWDKDQDIYHVSNIRLPYNKAVFTLEYTALEFSRPDKIKYAYFLEGWDKTWNYVDGLRTANYSRMPDGRYKLHIKSTNPEGAWNSHETIISLTILPPWWRSWWAYTLYGLLLIGALYMYNSYTKRQSHLKYQLAVARLTAEKEKELNDKKISFFTHIAHEFRTPLTLIINPLKEYMQGRQARMIRGDTNHGAALRQAEDSNHGEEPKSDLTVVYRNARRLLSLVDQLLLFRKAEAEDQPLRTTPFNLVEIGREVYLSFTQHARSKNIRFNFIAPPGTMGVYADREKIEIILFNLVSNAFKFTNPGGAIDFILEANEERVLVSVKDTGCGIAPETGNRLFDSFYQSAGRENLPTKGFGIGLYLARKLALQHKGNIYYESELGKGTVFHFELPPAIASDGYREGMAESLPGQPDTNASVFLDELVEEPDTPEIPADTAIRDTTGIIDQLTSGLPSMLIVDDNADIRHYIRQIFEASFTIHEAPDGLEGYELAVQSAPDIIISDILMKTVSGIELCVKIKENPSIAHIPIILLTASSATDIKLKGIEVGAEDFITKPFEKEILIARVRNILKGRNNLQQYFYNAITLQPNFTIAGEHKAFIERCIAITEDHLDDPGFNIQVLSREIGMSHSNLYKKVKSVSGLTINVFIRYLRLRKAAELFINTDNNITEVAYAVGINDLRYFREQFFKLFKMNPSEYIRRYRRVLGNRSHTR